MSRLYDVIPFAQNVGTERIAERYRVTHSFADPFRGLLVARIELSLGHASITTTERYLGVSPGPCMMRRAIIWGSSTRFGRGACACGLGPHLPDAG